MDSKQSMVLPSVTDDDMVAVVENSPSDAASVATGSDVGCQSTWSSPRRTCPSTAGPNVHSAAMTQAEPDDDVFRATPGATLTVDSCLVDGRPSLSVSTDGPTELTRLSGSDDSPLPDIRPSTSLALTTDPAAQVRLAVPSSPLLPQPRDRMPTRRSRRSARATINFQSLTAPRCASRTHGNSSKRSTRREKKVTKTLAIVLGKTSSFITANISQLVHVIVNYIINLSFCRISWRLFRFTSAFVCISVLLCGSHIRLSPLLKLLPSAIITPILHVYSEYSATHVFVAK